MKIADITISRRRREDLGDLKALADSILHYGLLHPIVVDDAGNLVAGERRLKACQLLGWEEIDTRSLGELSESERQEIELEENVRRKDLTPYERSKNLVKLAEQAATVLREEARHTDFRSESDQKSRGRPSEPDSERSKLMVQLAEVAEENIKVSEVPKVSESRFLSESDKNLGGRPEKTNAQAKVAERIGVPRTTIIAAKQHVAAVAAHPDLADKPQSVAIAEAKKRRGEPPPRPKADTSKEWLNNLRLLHLGCDDVERQGGMGKVAEAWSPEARQKAITEIEYICRQLGKWAEALRSQKPTPVLV